MEEDAIAREDFGIVGGSVKDAFEEIPMPNTQPAESSDKKTEKQVAGSGSIS